jgi:hypothetical protein
MMPCLEGALDAEEHGIYCEDTQEPLREGN